MPQNFLLKIKRSNKSRKKEKIIGYLFIKVFEKDKKYNNIKYLAQGRFTQILLKVFYWHKTSKIKSHHNVGGLPKLMKLKLIEPLKEFFKDEVRVLGKSLNLVNET